MSRAVLSLGSNLGDRPAHLRRAVAELGSRLVAVSGVYETPPWGDPDQPWYLNAVAVAVADLDPDGWLALAQSLERAAGRVRDPERRFGPRSLDVDVIAVWDDTGAPVSRADEALTLPHPRAHLRAFVLRPWLEAEPYANLAGHGMVNDLLRDDRIAGDVSLMIARTDLDLLGPSA